LGGSGSGGDTNSAGQPGYMGVNYANGPITGFGGPSAFSGGGASQTGAATSFAGIAAAANSGAGGSGAGGNGVNANQAGGAGGSGLVIVWEFS
jgi:hypothetical protein